MPMSTTRHLVQRSLVVCSRLRATVWLSFRNLIGMVYLFSLNRKRAAMDVVFGAGSGRSLTCFGRVMIHGLPLPE